jgi:hypothetical protein
MAAAGEQIFRRPLEKDHRGEDAATSSVTKLGFAGAAMPDGLLKRVDLYKARFCRRGHAGRAAKARRFVVRGFLGTMQPSDGAGRQPHPSGRRSR